MLSLPKDQFVERDTGEEVAEDDTYAHAALALNRPWRNVDPGSPPKRAREAVHDAFQGPFCVVLTGTFPELGGGRGLRLGKDAATRMVEEQGGRVVSSISGKTTHLVTGKDPGQIKLQQATERGVSVVSLPQLLDIIASMKRAAPVIREEDLSLVPQAPFEQDYYLQLTDLTSYDERDAERIVRLFGSCYVAVQVDGAMQRLEGVVMAVANHEFVAQDSTRYVLHYSVVDKNGAFIGVFASPRVTPRQDGWSCDDLPAGLEYYGATPSKAATAAGTTASTASADLGTALSSKPSAAASKAKVSSGNHEATHFRYFANRRWALVECGGNGNCLFWCLLLINKLLNPSPIPMYKTHQALRKQVVKHMEENLEVLMVCGEPMSALIEARPANFFKRMATPNEDAEYEIICGFAHMAQVTVVVYSLHCQLPQVIFPDGRSLGTRERVPETAYKLYTNGGHYQAVAARCECFPFLPPPVILLLTFSPALIDPLRKPFAVDQGWFCRSCDLNYHLNE
jgi:hypothetical protein